MPYPSPHAARDADLQGRRPATPERGAALLVMLLIVLLGSGIVALRLAPYTHWNRQARELGNLVAARELLVSRSLALWDNEQNRAESRPGALRCNDLDNDGSADVIGCRGRVLGRFPWRSLRGADSYRDRAGRNFWYAVAPALADWGSSQHVVNIESVFLPQSSGLLDLDGEAVAAILIAAGPPLPRQLARMADPDDPAAYLESMRGERRFSRGGDRESNDRLLAIRLDDYMPLVERLALSAAAESLRAYHANDDCRTLPWPAPFKLGAAQPASREAQTGGSLPIGLAVPVHPGRACPARLNLPQWLIINQWHRTIYYAVAGSDDCGEATLPCLRLRADAGERNSVLALLVGTGQPLAGLAQNRPGIDLGDYLEGANRDGRSPFEQRERGVGFNDQVEIVLEAGP